MKKKLLYITYWYPPFQVIGAQRAVSFVNHLQNLGWEVAVVTVRDHKWAFNGKRNPNWQESGEKIYRLNGLNIAETLKCLSKGKLKGAGQATDTNESTNLFKRFAKWFYNNLLTFPDECSIWYLLNQRKIRKISQDFKPDVIFSSALPASSHLLASKAQKEINVPWIAEFRDLWSGNPLKIRNEAFERKHFELEKKTLANAYSLVTVSSPLAKELEQKHGKKVDVIYNGFEPDEFSCFEKTKNKKLTIVYTGMVYPDKQHPEILFKALSKLPKGSELLIKFYTPSTLLLSTHINKYKVSQFCEFNDVIPREQALKEQQSADLLLFFTFDIEGCLSGKIFEYLGASRPILLVGQRDAELTKIVVDNGAGVQLEKIECVYEELLRFLEQFEIAQEVEYFATKERFDYTRIAMVQRLDKYLQMALRKNE